MAPPGISSQGGNELRDGYRQISENRTVHEPVSPADGKSRCVAKRAAHINIEAASSREHEAQLRQATCTQQGVYTSRNPQ